MKRGGSLQRRTPLKSTRWDYRPRARSGWAAVRDACRERDGSFCQRCEGWVPGGDAHHLLPRGRGGRDELANLVWLCRRCHSWVHTHTAEAEAAGWLRKSGANLAPPGESGLSSDP